MLLSRRLHFIYLCVNKHIIIPQELSETNTNFLVSPASIKATLAMILEGAYGKCAEEIKNALRLRLDQPYGKSQVQALISDLNVR